MICPTCNKFSDESFIIEDTVVCNKCYGQGLSFIANLMYNLRKIGILRSKEIIKN